MSNKFYGQKTVKKRQHGRKWDFSRFFGHNFCNFLIFCKTDFCSFISASLYCSFCLPRPNGLLLFLRFLVYVLVIVSIDYCIVNKRSPSNQSHCWKLCDSADFKQNILPIFQQTSHIFKNVIMHL